MEVMEFISSEASFDVSHMSNEDVSVGVVPVQILSDNVEETEAHNELIHRV